MGGRLSVGLQDVKGRELRLAIAAEGDIAKYVPTCELVYKYSIDVDGAPHGMLRVPGVAALCTVAWATGADIHVDCLDKDFARTLVYAQRNFGRLYPAMVKPSMLLLGASDPTGVPATVLTGLLFSGGVDSLYSFLTQTADGFLFCLQTRDIIDAGRWRERLGHLQEFATEQNISLLAAESNAVTYVDYDALQRDFGVYLVGSWWGGCQHGILLAGAMAPLFPLCGVGRLLIASTNTQAFDQQYPWGSRPDLEGVLEIGGVVVSHDGYGVSRQQKVQKIVRELAPQPILTCINRTPTNCGQCFKCQQTIEALTAEGQDPTEWGFPDMDGAEIAAAVLARHATMGADERALWEDIAKRGTEPAPWIKELFG